MNAVLITYYISVLNVIHKEKLIENADRIGNYLLKRLKEMQESHEIIGDIRGLGLMAGIELVKDRETKTPATEKRNNLIDEAFKRGVLLLGAGQSSLRLAPPLIINKQQVDAGLEILEESLKAIEK